MINSIDGKYAFSAGEDGSIFIYQVQEISEDGTFIPDPPSPLNLTGHTLPFALKGIDKQEKDENKLNPKVGVVDVDLADVVLVSRGEIDNYLNE